MIEHIIIKNLEVEVAIGDWSFCGEQVAPVSAKVEFKHDMKRPHRVTLPDGVKLRCAMANSDPVMVDLPSGYDISDCIDRAKIMKTVLEMRMNKQDNEVERGLARNPKWEAVNHG